MTRSGSVVKLWVASDPGAALTTRGLTPGVSLMQPQYTPVLPFDKLAPYIDASGDCWEWTGRLNSSGYGSLSVKIDGKWRNRMAHRLVWVTLVGPVPDGLTLDHLCRVRHCVNPDHLEPVTQKVNNARGYGPPSKNIKKLVCIRGHDDWRLKPHKASGSSYRFCRSCMRADSKRRPSRSTVARRLRGEVFMPTRAQRAVLESMAEGHRIFSDAGEWIASPDGGRRVLRWVFDSLLRHGWIDADDDMGHWWRLTDAGRAAIEMPVASATPERREGGE